MFNVDKNKIKSNQSNAGFDHV